MDHARLISDPALPGAWNMAVDQALLAAVASTGRPVLRFYRWTPPTLSLGYFQSIADRESHRPSASCPVVRRATGGGAILHHRELTYSLCLPTGNRLAWESRSLYQAVHQSLIDVLGEWGLAAAMVSESNGNDAGTPFLCFQRRSPGDVLLGPSKICGSAQRRSGTALLQHGSILLAQSEFAPELPGIREITGIVLTDLDLESALAGCLERRLGTHFVPSGLTQNEESDSRRIRQGRFGHYEWTNRR
jgi:lipoate-protein ligase A